MFATPKVRLCRMLGHQRSGNTLLHRPQSYSGRNLHHWTDPRPSSPSSALYLIRPSKPRGNHLSSSALMTVPTRLRGCRGARWVLSRARSALFIPHSRPGPGLPARFIFSPHAPLLRLLARDRMRARYEVPRVCKSPPLIGPPAAWAHGSYP